MSNDYFIAYTFEVGNHRSIKNSIIHEHPIEWLERTNKDFPESQYAILWWKKMDYDKVEDFDDWEMWV